MSKQVVYDSEATQYVHDSISDDMLKLIRACCMNRLSIVIYKDITDEPKVERCEIVNGAGNKLKYTRAGQPQVAWLSDAFDDQDFAGFEFADGSISISQWRRKYNSSLTALEVPRAPFSEHAVYVLFRKP
jgi:hypothetical protein